LLAWAGVLAACGRTGKGVGRGCIGAYGVAGRAIESGGGRRANEAVEGVVGVGAGVCGNPFAQESARRENGTMTTLLKIIWLVFGSKLIPVSLMPLGKEIVPSNRPFVDIPL
jgi:hypothetical protein